MLCGAADPLFPIGAWTHNERSPSAKSNKLSHILNFSLAGIEEEEDAKSSNTRIDGGLIASPNQQRKHQLGAPHGHAAEDPSRA